MQLEGAELAESDVVLFDRESECLGWDCGREIDLVDAADSSVAGREWDRRMRIVACGTRDFDREIRPRPRWPRKVVRREARGLRPSASGTRGTGVSTRRMQSLNPRSINRVDVRMA